MTALLLLTLHCQHCFFCIKITLKWKEESKGARKFGNTKNGKEVKYWD